MDSAELLKGVMNFGLSGMLFYMWYMNSRKENSLQRVIEEQVRDKEVMREDRAELLKTIRDQSTTLGRVGDMLERVEQTLTRLKA